MRRPAIPPAHHVPCLALCLAVLLALSSPAAAEDIIATWKQADGETIKVSYRDDSHVRMDVGDGYVLLTGSKLYSVAREDGQQTVVDMEQAMGMARAMGMGQPKTSACAANYADTGRSETVAGYAGKVYEVTVTGCGMDKPKDEAVLSSDPDVVKAGRAWAAIASRMARLSGASGADASHLVAGGGKGGLLRYGQDITLVALAKKSLAASHYELPKGARPVDMGAAARDGGGSAADEAGQEAAQDAKDIGRAAKDEAKSTVTDGVRDGVRSAIGGLFQ